MATRSIKGCLPSPKDLIFSHIHEDPKNDLAIRTVDAASGTMSLGTTTTKSEPVDDLLKMVQEKTGLDVEQAKSAIEAVFGFLKDKLPEPIAGQLENLIGGDGEGLDIGDALGGLDDFSRQSMELVTTRWFGMLLGILGPGDDSLGVGTGQETHIVTIPTLTQNRTDAGRAWLVPVEP